MSAKSRQKVRGLESRRIVQDCRDRQSDLSWRDEGGTDGRGGENRTTGKELNMSKKTPKITKSKTTELSPPAAATKRTTTTRPSPKVSDRGTTGGAAIPKVAEVRAGIRRELETHTAHPERPSVQVRRVARTDLSIR